MKEILSLFRWQDGLDILILTYIFYRLFLWLRKKRALRMIIAILALPLFYLFAQWIDLPLSIWGFQNLWPVIIIVLVVIFQQEIREVLGNVSLPNFFFGRPERLSSKIIDKIADTAFKMADKRMGGLIVLQRGDDLDEFIHDKIFLDAEINEDITLNLHYMMELSSFKEIEFDMLQLSFLCPNLFLFLKSGEPDIVPEQGLQKFQMQTALLSQKKEERFY
jgi:diadenylate cyclase